MNIFIDTQDIEERYGEQLYQDYLAEQNKDLKQRIDKANNFIKKQKRKMYKNGNKIAMYNLLIIEEILGEKK